jgi:hypothetical protein
MYEETRDFAKSGATKASHTDAKDVLYLGERRYEHIIQRDGKPLPAAEAQREQEKLDHTAAEAAKLTNDQKAARRAQLERERRQRNEFWKYIPAAYTLLPLADVVLNGCPTYVIRLAPKPGYHGKYASLLRNAQGTLFIDKRDFMLVRMQAEILGDVSFGLFLGRIDKGSRVTYELTRINNEVWLPHFIETHGAGRELFKSIRRDEKITYSDYRKYRTESRIVDTSQPSDPTAPPTPAASQ